jgi:hypothetical protein
MKMLKTTLTAVALAALTTTAFAATEPSEDVTAAINNDQTDTTSLPSMQPSSGDTSTPTANTTSPAANMPPPTSTVAPNSSATSGMTANMDAINAQKMALRRLTGDEMTYTRNYIISSVGGLRDLSAVQDRLNKGMDDIASTMKTYIGEDAGNKLDSLLHDQVSDNIALIQAAKSKNQKTLQDAQTRAQNNADDIAALLSGVNANTTATSTSDTNTANANVTNATTTTTAMSSTGLSKDDISSALRQNIDFISSQVASRVKKDWKSDIDAYDRDEDQMMALSDKIIDGLATQYPDKFSSVPSSIAPASGP